MSTAPDFADLFAALRFSELSALLNLAWQSEPIAGEAVAAVLSAETGVVAMTGAMPFLETRKGQIGKGDRFKYLKSDVLADFLVRNRAFFRTYLQSARDARLKTVGDYSAAHLTQVSTELAGMEAANFAVFLAATVAAETGRETLLIDADPENQYVFPLLPFSEAPKILTENLQKPSTFRADLGQCIVDLKKGFSYLNAHASSLRPFDDDEFARIVSHLDSDYENIVVYSGRFASPWLSQNAQVNYAVTEDSYRGEMTAIGRHAAGSHTVLLKKARDSSLPALAPVFSQKLTPDQWLERKPATGLLRDFTLRVHRATKLVIGGKENLPGHLHCQAGLDLFAWYEGLERGQAERAINAFQKRLRAYYPKSSFFSSRSILNHIRNLPQRAVTTVLEVGTEPQLVSLPCSAQLRANAIFPSGIIPASSFEGLRVSACTVRGFGRLRATAARGAFQRVLTAPRYRMDKPDALAAVMEQVQA